MTDESTFVRFKEVSKKICYLLLLIVLNSSINISSFKQFLGIGLVDTINLSLMRRKFTRIIINFFFITPFCLSN